MPVDIVNNFSNLEPLLSMALALNLAYLNISSFAYLSQISKIAKTDLDCLDPNARKSNKDAEWFKSLEHLSKIEILENNFFFFLEKGSRWVHLPMEWTLFYNIFFLWRLAKFGAAVFTLYSMFYVTIEVAAKLNIEQGIVLWAVGSSVKSDFIWVTLAMLWPVACAAAGTWCRWRAASFSRYQIGKLPKATQKKAEELIPGLLKYIQQYNEAES